MMSRISGLLGLLMLSLLFGLSGCASHLRPAGHGGVQSTWHSAGLPPFHGIVAEGTGYHVTLVANAQDDSVHLRGPAVLVKNTRVFVRRGILHIVPPQGTLPRRQWGEAAIDVRHLNVLRQRGQSTLTVVGVEAETLRVVADGGYVTISGMAQHVRARASGRARLDLRDLQAKNVLSLEVVGHARAYYRHDPTQLNQHTSGNGQILRD